MGKTLWQFRRKAYYHIVRRPHYAYGVLKAAKLVKLIGKQSVTICEFGVATGDGLMDMVELAKAIKRESGVDCRIASFDTGEGRYEVKGSRDHPEYYLEGDFAMSSQDELRRRGCAEQTPPHN